MAGASGRMQSLGGAMGFPGNEIARHAKFSVRVTSGVNGVPNVFLSSKKKGAPGKAPFCVEL